MPCSLESLNYEPMKWNGTKATAYGVSCDADLVDELIAGLNSAEDRSFSRKGQVRRHLDSDAAFRDPAESVCCPVQLVSLLLTAQSSG